MKYGNLFRRANSINSYWVLSIYFTRVKVSWMPYGRSSRYHSLKQNRVYLFIDSLTHTTQNRDFLESISFSFKLACSASAFFGCTICYRKGYYFYSPQSSTVIKSKMAATTILRTRTRFRPPKIRLHCRLVLNPICQQVLCRPDRRVKLF